MHDIVNETFAFFSTQFEGRVPYMYLDIKGLVTIGVGNLIDPVETALEVAGRHPFHFKNSPGSLASIGDVRAEWNLLKSDPTLAQRGHLACEPITQLRLSDVDIDALVLEKSAANEQILLGAPAFASLQTWPADAQLALFSMAWAMGPAFSPIFPSFSASCADEDWDGAAANCRINDVGNPGLTPRNVANRVLFANAAFVAANALDFEQLSYVPSGERPSLALGSSGAHVSFLQERLFTLDYLGAVSAFFDNQTDEAVRQLQSDYQLTVDGKVGPSTWAALGTGIPAGEL